MSSPSITLVLIILLSVPNFVSAQDSPGSLHASQLLKRCSDKNPPPCIEKGPVVKNRVDPEYSEDARRAKVEGVVVLWAIIDTDGRAHYIRVARVLGHGLDEKAIEALRRWKFTPATSEGKPVPSAVNVEVNFRLR